MFASIGGDNDFAIVRNLAFLTGRNIYIYEITSINSIKKNLQYVWIHKYLFNIIENSAFEANLAHSTSVLVLKLIV